MKGFIVLLIISFCSLAAYCQERHTIGYFRSFPVGKFGSKHLENGGFAKSGWGFLLENNTQPKFFPKFLTFGTRFSYQKNQIDTDAMSRRFAQVLGRPTRIDEASYEPILLMTGPHVEIAIRPKLFVKLKTGFGVMFTKVNAFKIEVLDAQGNMLLDDVIDASGNIPFAYMGGAQVRLAVTKNIAFGLFADYISARGRMSGKLGNVKTQSSEFDIALLNMGAALRLDF